MDVITLAKINALKKSGGVGYTETTKKTLLSEQTFQAERLSAGLYMFDLLSPLEIIESDKVTVNWNGKQYTCEAISFEAEGETAVVFGDMAIMDGNVNTGEPFFYASRAGLGTFFTTDNGTVTVSVTAETETVHTIDPKFLPSPFLDIVPYLGEYANMQESLARDAQIEKKDLETILAGLQTGRILGLSRTLYAEELGVNATELFPFTMIQSSTYMTMAEFHYQGTAYTFGVAEEEGVCMMMILEN